MKLKTRTLFLLFILISFLGCGKTDNISKTDYNKKYSVAKLQEDIDYVYRTINEVHPAFYDNAPLSDSLRARLDSLKRAIKKTKSRSDFFAMLAPIVTRLNDENTKLEVPWADFRII